MANGVDAAKKIVIDEATDLVKQLQNGSAGDSHTQGKAIGLLVKMIIPLFAADFMTKKDCSERLEGICSAERKNKLTRIKIGPVVLEGAISILLMQNMLPLLGVSIAVFVLGKLQLWW